ncbi:acetyl-CoA carboxylase biotin carboxyl carrier protein subunit [Mariniphaga sediminis]|jgi:biotin carboxyl carrier protein|uniref:Acetyl-CoA carboxylase biotin carboxyl carrier protein subunit n=1 Tax=Mariniphaga sediminis TaxID=1628158 RepID=A0A399CY35_9BACT|nr:biotin/lipoyl-containing protein [Mariniphaga sediminis]RIH64339.1 acetyl-CoA carboxylase biotin carboxyl carrier protein subunit [Mariniphaga sediminis]
MKKYKFTISGHDYDVHIKDIEDNIAEVDVNGTHYEVVVHNEIKTSKTPRLVRKPLEKLPGEGQIKKKETSGKFEVTAPLPGTILKLNVAVGDVVAEGQNVLVMEAMKMENQVQTTKGGEVLSVKVNVGDAVQQDDVLLEIG